MTETSPRIRSQVIIIDPLGLHLRPAAKLVVLAKSFRSDIRIVCNGYPADARSIIDLVTLAAGCGTTLDIVAHGPDAEQAVVALTDLLGAGLGNSVVRGAAA